MDVIKSGLVGFFAFHSVGVGYPQFLLGANNEKYLYFVGDSIAGFKLESVPASATIIKYIQTEEKPYALIKERSSIFGVDIDRAELYLPFGAVVQDYKIDL